MINSFQTIHHSQGSFFILVNSNTTGTLVLYQCYSVLLKIGLIFLSAQADQLQLLPLLSGFALPALQSFRHLSIRLLQ